MRKWKREKEEPDEIDERRKECEGRDLDALENGVRLLVQLRALRLTARCRRIQLRKDISYYKPPVGQV